MLRALPVIVRPYLTGCLPQKVLSCLYEMLSGRLPFSAESEADTLYAVLTLTPPPLTNLANEVPAEMQRIVSKCLEKDCANRYQSAGEVLVDLTNLKRQIDAGLVVISAPTPRRGRLRYSTLTGLLRRLLC